MYLHAKGTLIINQVRDVAIGIQLNRRVPQITSFNTHQTRSRPISLSQFLSIQEKGVSTWSFEPDLEAMHSLLVHARTEITFLPDPSSASSVQSNLPLPKLNEVYYWEVKMFDLPPIINVAVGLATKPYPSFRLPGHSRFSIAYHSNGADGPCSVHANLGQAGFVFIEANVSGAWRQVLEHSPPSCVRFERGSILLAAGDSRPPSRHQSPLDLVVSSNSSSPGRRSTHRSRRPKRSALVTGNLSSPPFSNPEMTPPPPLTPPPPITPIDELSEAGNAIAGPGPSSSGRYISPTGTIPHSDGEE